MDPTRTRPVAGAMFAINMLVGTPGGGTFTVEELQDDLKAARFTNAAVVRQDQGMNAVLLATRN